MEYYAILKINNPKAPIFSRITTDYIATKNQKWLKSIGIESEILPIYKGKLEYDMTIEENRNGYNIRYVEAYPIDLEYMSREELTAAFQTELLHKVDILDNVYEDFLELAKRLRFDPNGSYEPQYDDEGYKEENIYGYGVIKNLIIVGHRAREIDNL